MFKPTKIVFLLIFSLDIALIPFVSCENNETESSTTNDIVADKMKTKVNDNLQLAAPRFTFPIVARDCAEVLTYFSNARSDVYRISPIPGNPIEVFCNMDYDNGGWTVIQRRGEPLRTPKEARPDFFRGWNDYEKGFGNVRQDYWLGLTNIAALTRIEDSELMVELVDWTGDTRIVNYKTFQVGNSADNYKLTVRDYIGTAGDSFSAPHNGMKFSTKDRDQDSWPNNCAQSFKGGWWYDACHASNLNGLYAPEGSNGTTVDFAVGIVWNTWKGQYYSLKQARMSIRSKALR